MATRVEVTGAPRIRRGTKTAGADDRCIRRYDPAETRTRILEAANQLFSTIGYRNTGTADIARAADVSEGSIFYHFGSKLALLDALGRIHGEKMVARMQGDDDIADLDPSEVIRRCFAFVAENKAFEASDTDCDIAKNSKHDPDSAPFFLAAREVTQVWVEAHIRAYFSKRGVTGIDFALVASMIFGAVNDAMHNAFAPGVTEAQRHHIMEQCASFVRRSCAV